MAHLRDHLDDHWRDFVVEHGVRSLQTQYDHPHAPLFRAPDADPAQPVREELDVGIALLNSMAGVQGFHSEDLAAALSAAVNDWLRAEWLDRDPRLRASMVVPQQSAELAVTEIERLAGDPRFVSVLLLGRGETPLGRRHLWPIYEAAQRHRLPIAIHAGGNVGSAITPVGWPSHLCEDTITMTSVLQAQLLSLIAEGVFKRFPDLRVVLLESGVTWLPSFLWRADKDWKGLRREVPWVDRLPSEIVRDQVRISIHPFDGPADFYPELVEQVGGDSMFVFASDHPHWSLDPPLPALSPGVLTDNARGTFVRLADGD
jgi:predicted TIM-barrel fold metal-dependent hydrolase